MRRVHDEARMATCNESLARAANLTIPKDIHDLEALMKHLFLVELDTGDSTPAPEGESPPPDMIATHYLDGARLGKGQAMGDGRAVWSGEVTLPLKNGKILYLDIVEKGSGQTPLAWTDNDPSHSDGKMKK